MITKVNIKRGSGLSQIPFLIEIVQSSSVGRPKSCYEEGTSEESTWHVLHHHELLQELVH